jgi:hypothetical protein
MVLRFNDLSQPLKRWHSQKQNCCVAYWAMSLCSEKNTVQTYRRYDMPVSTYSTNLLNLQVIWCAAQKPFTKTESHKIEWKSAKSSSGFQVNIWYTLVIFLVRTISPAHINLSLISNIFRWSVQVTNFFFI